MKNSASYTKAKRHDTSYRKAHQTSITVHCICKCQTFNPQQNNNIGDNIKCENSWTDLLSHGDNPSYAKLCNVDEVCKVGPIPRYILVHLYLKWFAICYEQLIYGFRLWWCQCYSLRWNFTWFTAFSTLPIKTTTTQWVQAVNTSPEKLLICFIL